MADRYRGYILSRIEPETVRISAPDGRKLVDCDSAALARRVIDDRVRRGVWEELGHGVAGQMRMEVEEIWH